MRAIPLLSLLFAACQTDTGFTHQDDDGSAIEGDAKMELSATVVVWEDLNLAQTYSRELIISSTGERNLLIYEARVIDSAGGVFYLPDEWKDNEKTIMPGTSVTMVLTAYFDEDSEAGTTAEGSLKIRSNDVDETEHLLSLTATLASGVDTGGVDTGESSDTGTTQ
jgi:hypothetical protein